MSDKSYTTRAFSYKTTRNIDFTAEPVVQCDVNVVKNSFVGDCK